MKFWEGRLHPRLYWNGPPSIHLQPLRAANSAKIWQPVFSEVSTYTFPFPCVYCATKQESILSEEASPHLNNRVLLSKALSCDRLPEEIWCSQQIVRGLIWSLNIKFPREPTTHRAWDRRTLLFYCTTLNLSEKRALGADRRPLRRDPNA